MLILGSIHIHLQTSGDQDNTYFTYINIGTKYFKTLHKLCFFHVSLSDLFLVNFVLLRCSHVDIHKFKSQMLLSSMWYCTVWTNINMNETNMKIVFQLSIHLGMASTFLKCI